MMKCLRKLKRYSRITKFDDIIVGVLNREGGYVNDPKDPGGETKYGISKRSNRDIDIKNLTKEEASNIYYERYWKPSRVNKLPMSLRETFFDMVVNMGQYASVRVLQKASNAKNPKHKIKVDGKIGPNTIKATKKLEIDRLRAFRMLHYAKLVLMKPALMKFWFGWYRRCQEV